MMTLLWARYWQAIVGGLVAAGLAVALIATRATLSDRTDALAESNRLISAERQSHAVTKTSLNICLATNQEMTEASDVRAAEYAKARDGAAETEREMDRKRAADAGRGAYLSGVASGAGNGCAVPDAVLDKLKGL